MVVMGTPLESILEAAEWRRRWTPLRSLPTRMPARWKARRTTA